MLLQKNIIFEPQTLKTMRKKRILSSAMLIAALLAVALLCSCSSTHYVCPAYGNGYHREVMPY